MLFREPGSLFALLPVGKGFHCVHLIKSECVTQTTLTRDASKNPTWSNPGPSFSWFGRNSCAPEPSFPCTEQVGCSQAQSLLFPLLMILHCLVLSGLQEENRSCQEGVSEGLGCLPGQPRLQGTALLTDGLNSQEPPGRSSFIRNAV